VSVKSECIVNVSVRRITENENGETHMHE
jgi:hypothetical protein